MSNVRILFLGDIVGEPGRKSVIERLPAIKHERQIDFIIVNGENTAGGKGITPKIAIDLLRAGVAVITTGDHVWDQKEITDYLPTEPRVLRPLNYPDGTPGFGSVVLETNKGKIAVMQSQGTTFMQHALENPFLKTEREARRLRDEEGVRVIALDFHAEATSEKIAMGYAMDGLVSLVAGTHTHVQTADEAILPGGTGTITDVGMCGPAESVLGRVVESVLWKFKTSMPTRFPIARGPVRLCGVVIEVDPESGRCLHIERFSEIHDSEPAKTADPGI